MAKEDARLELLMRQIVQDFPLVPAANRIILELPKVFEMRTKVDAELATDWLLKEHHDVHDKSGGRAANAVPAWPETDDLTSKQLELVKMVEPLLVLNREDPSFHQASCLLVHGGPGTGKSYFVRHLAKTFWQSPLLLSGVKCGVEHLQHVLLVFCLILTPFTVCCAFHFLSKHRPTSR